MNKVLSLKLTMHEALSPRSHTLARGLSAMRWDWIVRNVNTLSLRYYTQRHSLLNALPTMRYALLWRCWNILAADGCMCELSVL